MKKLIYDKYILVNESLRPNVKTLLDVGCRDAVLKRYLPPHIHYVGIDMFAGPGVDRVANVEEGLPFADNEFDVVVALDLLEHTNDIWFVFDELVRVSRSQVIIVLPNLYHWLARLKYLAGREFGKYVLSVEPIADRHRWLTSYESARRFCIERGKAKDMSAREYILFGGRRTVAIDWVLSKLSNNLAAWAVMYVLEKRI